MTNYRHRQLMVGILVIALALLPATVQASPNALDSEIEAKLREMLTFDYSETVFTIQAFINYTGFTANNGMPLSPVRQGILDDLKAMNLQLKDNNFFTNKGFDPDYYDYYAKVTSGAPSFKPDYLPTVPASVLSGYGLFYDFQQMHFDEYLAEFYQEANIHALYEKWKPEYMKEINRIKELSYRDLAVFFRIFKLSPEQFERRVVFDVSYLIQAGRGETIINFPDYARGEALVIQMGPNPNNPVTGSMAVHEVLHSFVNPIMDRNPDMVKRFIRANDITPAGPYSAEAMVDEIFIRALDGIPRDECVNYDTIEFPRMVDIFNYYKSSFDPQSDNLESFVLKALDHFSQEPIDRASNNYTTGLGTQRHGLKARWSSVGEGISGLHPTCYH